MTKLGRTILILALALAGTAAGGAIGFVAQGEPSPILPRIETPAPPTAPQATPVMPDTLLAWTPGGLPDDLDAAVRRLPGVDRVVAVVSDTVWLRRSTAENGAVVDDPAGDLAIPLDVAAADLETYAPFLPPADRVLLSDLAGGAAVLGATSAELRRLGEGGVLDFGSRRLTVAGVFPDASIGAHEVFVSRDVAASLGATRERYLLIDPAAGASRQALTEQIRDLLPPGALLRVRGPGETPFFRQGDAVLPQVKIKEVFGEFAGRPRTDGYIDMDPAWRAAHIVTASVPILGIVTCNRALIPQLREALEQVQAEGLIHAIDPAGFGGCFSSRFLNRDPGASVSHHAWGVAVDINVPTNRFGQTPHQDPRLVSVFEAWGFTWGGTWIRPDGMHFEFIRFPGS